ncbi:unnamed protein product [Pleuronectes platessa]|uniref:Complexin-1 n=1 Tax=Pleuronectes platessa TaxID=8262 RepID=A0A9N7VNQ9_PLEPL|nr:unnamed protein product [Pleuronectes platessa]
MKRRRGEEENLPPAVMDMHCRGNVLLSFCDDFCSCNTLEISSRRWQQTQRVRTSAKNPKVTSVSSVSQRRQMAVPLSSHSKQPVRFNAQKNYTSIGSGVKPIKILLQRGEMMIIFVMEEFNVDVMHQGEGATKDMGKMLGGEEKAEDPDAQKKEDERQEALRQQEEERKAKYAKMESERENIRQGIRDKYGIKKKEEKEAEAAAAMEQASEGSLTRPKKAVPTGCGDEEEEESIVDTVMKFIPAPLMDMFNKK